MEIEYYTDEQIAEWDKADRLTDEEWKRLTELFRSVKQSQPKAGQNIDPAEQQETSHKTRKMS